MLTKLASSRQRACRLRSGSREAVPATATIQVRPSRSTAPLRARAALRSGRPRVAASAGATGNQRPLAATARVSGAESMARPSRSIQSSPGGRTNSRVMPGCSSGCRSRSTQGRGEGEASRLDSSTQAAAVATFTWDSRKSSKAARVFPALQEQVHPQHDAQGHQHGDPQQPQPGHAMAMHGLGRI